MNKEFEKYLTCLCLSDFFGGQVSAADITILAGEARLAGYVDLALAVEAKFTETEDA